jgi:hypothetical protein
MQTLGTGFERKAITSDASIRILIVVLVESAEEPIPDGKQRAKVFVHVSLFDGMMDAV